MPKKSKKSTKSAQKSRSRHIPPRRPLKCNFRDVARNYCRDKHNQGCRICNQTDEQTCPNNTAIPPEAFDDPKSPFYISKITHYQNVQQSFIEELLLNNDRVGLLNFLIQCLPQTTIRLNRKKQTVEIDLSMVSDDISDLEDELDEYDDDGDDEYY